MAAAGGGGGARSSFPPGKSDEETDLRRGRGTLPPRAPPTEASLRSAIAAIRRGRLRRRERPAENSRKTAMTLLITTTCFGRRHLLVSAAVKRTLSFCLLALALVTAACGRPTQHAKVAITTINGQ